MILPSLLLSKSSRVEFLFHFHKTIWELENTLEYFHSTSSSCYFPRMNQFSEYSCLSKEWPIFIISLHRYLEGLYCKPHCHSNLLSEGISPSSHRAVNKRTAGMTCIKDSQYIREKSHSLMVPCSTAARLLNFSGASTVFQRIIPSVRDSTESGLQV